jgi:S1-C subfamily serine protease
MEPNDEPVHPSSSHYLPQPVVDAPTPHPLLPAAPPVAPTPPALPADEPKTRSGYWLWFIAAALFAAAVASGAFFDANDDAPTANAVAANPAVTSTAPVVDAEGNLAIAPPETTIARPEITAVLLDASMVGDVVIPSVVTVQINGTAFGGETGPLGSGSGVVYDDQGHILTNDHVVAAGSSYEVVLSNGTVYPAELVGSDSTTDLAVLKVTADGLTPIELGQTDELTVGDPAVAVGSPLGLRGGPSLTVGVISAFGREVRTDSTTTLYGMLQTDAPITQGSSGGALVDATGRLVGITTAVGVSEVGIEGIGFATPIEIVERVADEIIASGVASRPFVGIGGITTSADTSDGGSSPVGVLIESIEPNSGAAAAGLAPGDVIAALNGDDVKTMNELVALLRQYGVGTTIKVTLDSGEIVAVTLGENPNP